MGTPREFGQGGKAESDVSSNPSKKKPRSAKDLIASKVKPPIVPPAAAISDIKAIIASNDTKRRTERVTCDEMLAWLREDHDWQHGKDTLVRWIRDELGRKSYQDAS